MKKTKYKIMNSIGKNYDLIIFNREKLKRISEYLINIISIFIYGIKDPLSGMKLYKVNVLKKKSILKENVDYVGMFFFKLYNKNNGLRIFKSDILWYTKYASWKN